jgi:hypothetical protein
MSHKKFSILNAMIVSSLGTGALLHAADSQLPVSPFIIPPPGKAGAGNVPVTTGNGTVAGPDNGPIFTGFVDTTYNYNFNRPPTGVNQYYSFDPQANTFALNNAQLELTGLPKGDATMTYMLKINFGTDAFDESSTSGPNGAGGTTSHASNLDVEEAWGWYVDPVSKVGLKAGKFVTYEGIEVIESMNDPTITRGLLFSQLEPYTHTGALLTWTGTVFDFAVGVVNGWDELTSTDQGKTGVAKMGITLGDPLALVVSALYGPQQAPATAYVPAAGGAAAVPATLAGSDSNKRGSIDVTGLTKLVPKWQINFQGNYGWEKNAPAALALGAAPNSQADWLGFGIQPVYQYTSMTTLAFRIELLDDIEGARTGVKQEIWSFSVCPGWQIAPHFLLRAEGRLDLSNEPVYLDHAGNAVKIQATMALETIYNFN